MPLAFMFGNLGLGEIGIIAVIILLLFGAKRIPQVARALGSSIAEFKKGRKDGEREGEAMPPATPSSRTISHDTVDAKELAGGKGEPRGPA